ncbi:holliday junction ATP-dependent DNA helicase RuvA [Firmicutes bacterium CAG:534]|nr:holliday junction ATP-dependent DNA helicase RuvA [Firmicutes bacterium CAG:534]
MIGFVQGKVDAISEDNVVIDTGGIGYNVRISAKTAQELPGIGQEVRLYTYTSVREDGISLFGFLSRDSLDIFKKIITVNGIGPKGGLAVLSVMSADELKFAIISGNAQAITKAPGIGKKTAERVILDLKDKISVEDTQIRKEISSYDGLPQTGKAQSEAVEALTALGYSATDALHAVRQIEHAEEMDVEAILKLALKNMF